MARPAGFQVTFGTEVDQLRLLWWQHLQARPHSIPELKPLCSHRTRVHVQR